MNISKKKVIVVTTGLLLLVIIFVLQNIQSSSNESSQDLKKIAIVFNIYGLGDKSFNDLCYDGILRAQENLGVEFDYSVSKNEGDYENLTREYAQSEEYDLIIVIGYEQGQSVKKVFEEYENQKFTIVDYELDLPNVRSITTNWSELTFLNGIIAGLSMDEKDSVVGVIIGLDLEYLKEGAIGFEAGIRYINPDADVIMGVVDDFSNPAKAKEMAISIYKKGAKYIQHISGSSGFGVFAAAKEMDKFAFGVDGNQNQYEPDYIVSTAVRRVDNILYDEIKSVVDGTWQPNEYRIGIKENVIDFEREGSNVSLEPNIIEVVEDVKKQIVKKELNIPSTRNDLEVWLKANQYY